MLLIRASCICLHQLFIYSAEKSSGLIHAPPPTQKDKAAQEEKLKSKSKDEKDRKEKKEKKKKKREREDASLLQKLLAPLVTELRGLTWAGWIVSGKAGNPFISVRALPISNAVGSQFPWLQTWFE